MSEFDPYLKWLGIRETSRPVNHYRLLGLELFESDKDVISMAADRQMTHIRTYQSGPNGTVSQKILNELARARRCLLVDEKKAVYDQELRAVLEGRSAQAAVVPATAVEPPEIVPAQAVDTPVIQPTVVESQPSEFGGAGAAVSDAKLEVRTDPNAREKTKSREKKQLIMSLLGWVSGGLAALGVGAFLLGSGILGTKKNPVPAPKKQTKFVAKSDSDSNSNSDPDSDIGSSDGNFKAKKSDSKAKNKGAANLAKRGGDSSDSSSSSKSKAGNNPKGTDGAGAVSPPSASPSFELPVVYTVEDLGSYPAPNNFEKSVLAKTSFDVNSKRLQKMGSSAPTTAGTNGVKQEILGLNQPSLLIGMTYTLDKELRIATLQPVLRTQDSLVSNASRDSRLVIAKPGYVVGEVQASVMNPMNCFRVKFMKVSQDGLDRDDSYFSSWIGHEAGPVRTIENPLPCPIVAMYCDTTTNKQVQTMGLIGAHRSMRPAEIVAEVAATKSTSTDTDTGSSTNTNQNIIGKSLPVISRRPVPSSFFTSGTPQELVMFVNKLDEDVEVYGIDENMNQKRFFRLGPGSSRSYPTLVGASWHVKRRNLGIATYKAERGRNTAIIDARAPDISGSSELPEVADLKKTSIPTSGDRSAAMKEVKKVYGDLISKAATSDAQGNRRNAETIIEDARDADEAAMQYVMLETAKEIAIEKGDCSTAMLALRELDRRFEDFDFWDEVVDAVEDSGRSLGRTGNKFMAQELESVLRILIDEAMQAGESRSAGKLVSYGMKAASRNGDSRAVLFYKSKDKEVDEVAKLQKQYESALVKLAADPENSIANIQKGRYLIVTLSDFEGALECWGKSDDDELLDIVKDETTPDVNASFLARRWQNLGKDADTVFGRRCIERAIEVLEAAGKSREARDLGDLLDK